MARDRFEQVVDKLIARPIVEVGEGVISRREALRLLRHEHAALVRTVKRLMNTRIESYMQDGRNMKLSQYQRSMGPARAWAIKDLREEVLALLEQRRTGA